MRFLYLATLILFLHTSLFAQIEIAPLTNNPVLKAHQVKLGKTRTESLLYTRMMADNCPDPTQVDTTFGEGTTIYVVAGDSALICIDQLAFTILDTAACLNCDGLLFGNVSYNPVNFCFTYKANPGIIAETADVLQIEATDLNGQTLLEFPIVVKRADQSFAMPASTLLTESSIDLCVGNIELPGEERNFAILDCNNPLYSHLSSPDSCITYTAQRFAELDEICIEVCDEFCVCDTYVFPISIEGDTLTLPFFEDFSNKGPFPDKNLWLDDNVYINTHFPYKPITVGVATFDGLDQSGSPYGGTGAADYLTSGYINLDGLGPSDSVYLSYFIQPKGLSNFFPGTLDSLVLQFRTDTSGWETIVSYEGLSGSTSPLAKVPMEADSIKSHHIRSVRFLHNRFQFRFINHCRRLGLQYLWHLDNVRIAKNESRPTGAFEDAAYTEVPSRLFNEYRHIPINHFKDFENQEITDLKEINLFNSSAFTRNINPNTLVINDVIAGTQLFIDTTLLVDDMNTVQNKLASQVHTTYTNTYDFSPLISQLPNNNDPLILETVYTLSVPDMNSQNEILYPNVGRNDTVRVKTFITDFFAYDDGSPEALVTGDNEGVQLATRFQSNIADSLVGVQFNFPHTGNILSADFVIKVWLDEVENAETPIYTSPPLSVVYPDLFYDTLYGFTTYRFQDEDLENIKIPIPAGTFFVGIEQTTEGRIGIGFDINSPDAVNHQLFKGSSFNAQWDTLIQAGAMMIRPVVGEEFPLFTETQEPRIEPASLQVNLYPNPAQNTLYLPVNQEKTNDLEMQIINSTGQILLSQAWQPQLDLNNWINGLYFIQIKDRKTGAQVKEKFLILR